MRYGVPFAGYALTALAEREVRMVLIAFPAVLIAFFNWPACGAASEPRRRRHDQAAARRARHLALGGGATASGADFTASSSSPGSSFATAADFNTVTATIGAPAGTLTGTPTITAAVASDRGIASVKLQYAPTGTSDWTDICATASCPWNTTAAADGGYDLRAVATDNAGYSPRRPRSPGRWTTSRWPSR